MEKKHPPKHFALGQVVATPGALRAINAAQMHRALARHVSGDWGDLDDADKKENDFSISRRLRIFSAYDLPGAEDPDETVRIWVITEADRSSTTVLLPDEY